MRALLLFLRVFLLTVMKYMKPEDKLQTGTCIC